MSKQLLIEEAEFTTPIKIEKGLKESISVENNKDVLIVRNIPATIADRKNQNGRIYTTEVLQEAIRNANFQLKTKWMYSQADEHPEGSFVKPSHASHVVINAYIKKNVKVFVEGKTERHNVMFMDWEILNTEEGKNLKALILQETACPTSIRGLGDMEGEYVTNYELLGCDVVSNPSSGTSMRMPVSESIKVESSDKSYLDESFEVVTVSNDVVSDVEAAAQKQVDIENAKYGTITNIKTKLDQEIDPKTHAETTITSIEATTTDEVSELNQALQMAQNAFANPVSKMDSVTITYVDDAEKAKESTVADAPNTCELEEDIIKNQDIGIFKDGKFIPLFHAGKDGYLSSLNQSSKAKKSDKKEFLNANATCGDVNVIGTSTKNSENGGNGDNGILPSIDSLLPSKEEVEPKKEFLDANATLGDVNVFGFMKKDSDNTDEKHESEEESTDQTIINGLQDAIKELNDQIIKEKDSEKIKKLKMNRDELEKLLSKNKEAQAKDLESQDKKEFLDFGTTDVNGNNTKVLVQDPEEVKDDKTGEEIKEELDKKDSDIEVQGKKLVLKLDKDTTIEKEVDSQKAAEIAKAGLDNGKLDPEFMVSESSDDMFDTPDFSKELENGINVEGKIVVLDKVSIDVYKKFGDKYRLAAVYSKDPVNNSRTYFFSYMVAPVIGFRGSRIDIMGIASPEQFKEFVKKYPVAGEKLLEIGDNSYVGYNVDEEYKEAAREAMEELNNPKDTTDEQLYDNPDQPSDALVNQPLTDSDNTEINVILTDIDYDISDPQNITAEDEQFLSELPTQVTVKLDMNKIPQEGEIDQFIIANAAEQTGLPIKNAKIKSVSVDLLKKTKDEASLEEAPLWSLGAGIKDLGASISNGAKKIWQDYQKNVSPEEIWNATIKGRNNFLQGCIDHGVKLNIRKNGVTPLMYAATKGMVDTVNVLAKDKQLLNAQNKDGNTALILATAYANDENTVEALLQNGADVNIANNNGKTVYDYAQKKPLIMNILNQYQEAPSQEKPQQQAQQTQTTQSTSSSNKGIGGASAASKSNFSQSLNKLQNTLSNALKLSAELQQNSGLQDSVDETLVEGEKNTFTVYAFLNGQLKDELSDVVSEDEAIQKAEEYKRQYEGQGENFQVIVTKTDEKGFEDFDKLIYQYPEVDIADESIQEYSNEPNVDFIDDEPEEVFDFKNNKSVPDRTMLKDASGSVVQVFNNGDYNVDGNLDWTPNPDQLIDDLTNNGYKIVGTWVNGKQTYSA